MAPFSKGHPARGNFSDESISAGQARGKAGAKYACELPLDRGNALVITGSMSSNPEDRSLRRDQIWPVQVVMDGSAYPVPFFRTAGELGVSSIAFVNPYDPSAPVFFSAGSDLCQLDCESRSVLDCGLQELVDVHEISHEQNLILIANTGADEVLSYSLGGGGVTRVSLHPFRTRVNTLSEAGRRAADRFHVNQAFRGLDGHLWALVHHFEGWQLLRRVMGSVIKTQGDGGVLDLDKKVAINLNLAAPHSVRIVNDEYWLMNSACNEIVVYSRVWQKLRTIPTIGWGRGLAICGGIAYAGLSPVRKRYRLPSDRSTPRPFLQAVRVSTGEPLAHALVLNVEQVNNVYCVARTVGEQLASL